MVPERDGYRHVAGRAHRRRDGQRLTRDPSLELELMGKREHRHQVLARGEVEGAHETRTLRTVLMPVDTPPRLRPRGGRGSAGPCGPRVYRPGCAQRSTSRPATQKCLLATRLAHGWSSGIPMVERSATYRARPPRWPSSSSPRWSREQPTIPASGTKAASSSASAEERVSASNPSTGRVAITRASRSPSTASHPRPATSGTPRPPACSMATRPMICCIVIVRWGRLLPMKVIAHLGTVERRFLKPVRKAR